MVKQEEFVEAGAGPARLGHEDAERVVEATLVALSEELSADETKDLLAQLPKYFKTVTPVSSPQAGRTPQAFVERVAEVAGEVPGDPWRHAASVLATLRDAVN